MDAVDQPNTGKHKKHWKDARTVRLIQLSASQIETYDLCKRKWWLSNVRKLPKQQKEPGTFGDVIHAVCQRFLEADNLGRDTNGNPVELFPEGWTKSKNRYTGEDAGEVNPAQAEVIKRLITAAIDEGVLERLDGRMVEAEFRDTIVQLKCPTCAGSGHNVCSVCEGYGNGQASYDPDAIPMPCAFCSGSGICKCSTCHGDGKGDNVLIVGFIDYVTPDGIQDHKSTKSMRYAKSKSDLRKNIQMLIYAKQLLDLLKEQGKPVPEKISLRHNVYCKDPNDLRVRKTEVFVEPEEVYEFWATLQVIAQDMSNLRRTANGWHDVPPPKSMAGACQAYGGCDYRGICGGQESEEMYEKRLALQQDISHNMQAQNTQGDLPASVAAAYAQQPETKKESTMGVMDRLLAQKNAQQTAPQQMSPAPQPVQHTAPVAPATVATQPAPAAAGPSAPPWANVNCMACSGIGFDTTGKPCRICDVSAATTGRAHSGMFQILPQGDGTAYWKHTQTGQDGLSPMMRSAGQPVQVEQRIQMPPGQTFAQPTVPQPTAPVQQMAAPAPAPAPAVPAPVAPQPTSAAPAAEAKGGRKKKSFTLLINCTVTEGTGSAKTRRMIDVFAQCISELNEMQQVKAAGGYYNLDAFKRRDIMSQGADAVAESLGGDMVLVDLANATPDFKALVEAVRPYAAVEIIGTPN